MTDTADKLESSFHNWRYVVRKSVSDLEMYLINTRDPGPFLEQCEKAFTFWQESWQKTFHDQNVIKGKLFADDFLDREMIALFEYGRPVALFFNNWFDLSRSSLLNHSYFKNYPPEIFDFFKSRKFHETMVLTYMTIHPEWRAQNVDIALPDILFSIAMLKFKECDCSQLIGYIRKDKSFYTSFYRHGAQHITSSVVYGTPVDYAFVTSNTARLSNLPGVEAVARKLWASRNKRGFITESSVRAA